jgi:hypothetical protein
MTIPRRLGLLAMLVAGSCAAPDSEIHLAPLFSRHTAPQYQHAEGVGGILRYRREADTEEWALSPVVWRRKNGHGDIDASFLGGLGIYEHDPDRERSYSRLFPLWSYRTEIRPDGIRDTDWAALLYLVAGGSSSDDLENYFWFFPFFGTGRDFWTYDEFRFFLFPLYLENHKEERDSYHWLWPFFGRAEGSEKGWHFWPFYGAPKSRGSTAVRTPCGRSGIPRKTSSTSRTRASRGCCSRCSARSTRTTTKPPRCCRPSSAGPAARPPASPPSSSGH